jgi:hypothetical protein
MMTLPANLPTPAAYRVPSKLKPQRTMLPSSDLGLTDEDELKGFARTIAKIEWLLLILVLVYLVAVK